MKKRDLRIDAVRGFSLLMIYSNHAGKLGGNPLLRDYSLLALTLTDCANVFVFVSGYLAGHVYGRLLETGGLRRTYDKALKRARQLYVWHVLTLATTTLLIGALRFVDPQLLTGSRLAPLLARPLAGVPAALGLVYAPYAFDVLRLYILFLLALPGGLWLLRRRPRTALLVSISLYAVPLVFRDAAISDWPDGRPWYFNPLSWQLLFFLGSALALRGLPGPERFWRSRGLLAACACVVVGGVLVRTAAPALMAAWDPRIPFIHDDLVWGQLPRLGKTRLEITRLVYFFALALVFVRLLPRGLRLWSSTALAPIVACGRYPLQTYSLSLFLVYLTAAAMRLHGGGDLVTLALTGAGWGLLMLTATARHARGQRAAPFGAG
jgi:hypothetical protein